MGYFYCENYLQFISLCLIVNDISQEMMYEYEEGMEPNYISSLVKAFKKNVTDGFFNFIILDCINEKISDYEELWSFAKSKGFKVRVEINLLHIVIL